MPTFCGSWDDECDFCVGGPCGVHDLVAMRQRVVALLATTTPNDDTASLLDDLRAAVVGGTS
jgi:hypothetical protein